jgi:hypothetical protein
MMCGSSVVKIDCKDHVQEGDKDKFESVGNAVFVTTE